MLPNTFQDLTELRPERSHKLLMLRCICVVEGAGTYSLCRWKRVESLELLLDVLEFGGASPNLVPVDILDVLIVGRLDDVEHVLRRVCVRGTGRSAVAFKVVEKSL